MLSCGTGGVYSNAACRAYVLSRVSGLGKEWCAASFYEAQPVTTSSGDAPLSARIAQEGCARVDVESAGVDDWEPGAVFLVSRPPDAASPYAADGRVSEARVATAVASTLPGQVARFELRVRAVSAGEGHLSLGLVVQRVIWFADASGGGGPEEGRIVSTVRRIHGHDDDDGGVDGGDGTYPAGAGAGVCCRSVPGSRCGAAGMRRSRPCPAPDLRWRIGTGSASGDGSRQKP
jgi:hypothetical protein